MKDAEVSNTLSIPTQVFNKGQECLVKFERDKTLSEIDRAKCLNEAEEIFNALLNDKKQSEVIAFALANVDVKRKNYGRAMVMLHEALRIKPDFIDAMNNIGYVYKLQNMVMESRAVFEKILELIKKPEVRDNNPPMNNADEANLHCNLGSTYVANGKPQEAIEIFTKALELDPDNAMARWNRSLGNLELGNYEKGFEEYDFGDRVSGTIDRRYGKPETPFWDGSKGKTVVIYGEQGIGDELMFASMIPDIMNDCNVIIDAHPRLADLFRNSFPTVPVYGTRKLSTPKADSLAWSSLHNIDAKLSMGSLGKFYRKKKEDFPGTPFLRANPLLIEKYKEKLAALGPRKKVGISWRGGVVETNKSTRKIKKDLLLPLLKCDVDFISLQYDKGIENEVKEFEDKYGVKLNHWPSTLADYDDTAGLVSNLDLIISVPQSVVHLAGALGVPTIQLCPVRALWQMGPYGENMPWYEKTANIWQEKDGDWEPVLAKAKEILCSL